MKKEVDKLKKEHNKVADWIEYFNHKLIDMENEIKKLKKETEMTRKREEILGRTLLHVVENRRSDGQVQVGKEKVSERKKVKA